MKRISLTFPALLLIVAAGAFAQGRGPGSNGAPPFPGGDRDILGNYLSLTSDQKSAWHSIQSEQRASSEALHTQERALGEQLHTALEGNDAAAIGTLMLQLRAIHAQVDAARAAADARFAALLTPEQKTKFAAFQAAAEFLQQQHGPGGPGGPPPPR
jgi:Spy/CpxP family protein refolding chaperone